MLDLGLNNEEPHDMLIVLGGLAETPCCCTSSFTDVDFQQDANDENIYWVHSIGSEVWSYEDAEEGAESDVLRAEINGFFRKNSDGDVLFSGVFECMCLNEDALPVHNVVHIDDVLVVHSSNNHVRAYDNKNDVYFEIA